MSVHDDDVAAMRAASLKRANYIRLWRAGRRAQWLAMAKLGAAGDALREMAVIAENPPEEAESWEVGLFLSCGPKLGEKRIHDICALTRVDQTKPLVLLPDLARAKLTAWLRTMGRRVDENHAARQKRTAP